MTRTSVGIATASVAWLFAVTAHAQSAPASDPATASSIRRDLIAQAQAASEVGDTLSALDLATRAASIEMTPSLRLFIAEQQERIGRWVDAYASAALCEHEANEPSSLSGREDIAAGCRELMAEARSHIVQVRLDVVGAESSAGTVIFLNGRRVGIDGSSPLAADPGPLVVEARRDNRVVARRDLVAESGQTVDVRLDLRPVVAATSPRPHDTFVARRSSSRSVPAGPIIVGSLGVASTVTAAVFFGLRQSAQGNCMQEGRALVCPSNADAMRANAAITYNTVADVTLGVGLAAIAGGVLWYVLDRRANERTAVRASVSPNAHGVFGAVEFQL